MTTIGGFVTTTGGCVGLTGGLVMITGGFVVATLQENYYTCMHVGFRHLDMRLVHCAT